MILEQTLNKAQGDLKQLRDKNAELEGEILELQNFLADKDQNASAQEEMEIFLQAQEERGEKAEQYELSSNGEQGEVNEDEWNTGWGAQGM